MFILRNCSHDGAGLVSLKYHEGGWQAGDLGKSCIRVQRQSAGRIPSCLEEISLLFFSGLQLIFEHHPYYKE